MGARTWGIATLCALGALLTAAGPAYAVGEGLGWSSPDYLSPDGDTGLAPSLGVLSDGTAVAGWAQSNGTGYFPVIASRPVAAPWSAPSPISSEAIDAPGAYSFGPRMAFDRDGHYVAAWLKTRPQTINGTPNTPWPIIEGATGTVTPGAPASFTAHLIADAQSPHHYGYSYTPQVFMTPDGTGAVTFPFTTCCMGDNLGLTSIHGASLATPAPPGAPQTSLRSSIQGGSNSDDSGTIPPFATAGPDATGLTAANSTEATVTTSPGYATTINGQSAPSYSAVLYTTTDPGSWPAPQVLPLQGFGAAVAVLATGKVVVTSPDASGRLLMWEPGDSSPVTLDPSIGSAPTKAAIATYSDGSATIAYLASSATGLEIREVTLSSTGQASPPLTLSTVGTVHEPHVAYASDGTTYVAWTQVGPGGAGDPETGVFISYRLPDGEFTPAAAVVSGIVDSHMPLIGVGPDGFVTVLAQINAGAGWRIAAFTHANPAVPRNLQLPQISAPPGVTPGAVLSCSRGSWTASPTGFLTEWLRDGISEGPGTAGSSHTITATEVGHQLACRVTASNQAGSGQATSLAVSPSTSGSGGTTTGGSGGAPTAGSTPRAGSIHNAGNSVSINLSCPAGGGNCPVNAQLTVGSSAHRALASRLTVVGAVSISLHPGTNRILNVGLNRAGRKLLAKRHKLTVLLLVLSGKRQLVHKTLLLKTPRRKHHR
jgi:hypothetical protein